MLDTINALASSQSVGQKHARQTPEDTLSAAKARLCALTENVSDWPLLSFYARLFGLVNSTNHILLHGTGSKGFAIRVDIVGKGPVSLCTLWNNGTIEFSLKR